MKDPFVQEVRKNRMNYTLIKSKSYHIDEAPSTNHQASFSEIKRLDVCHHNRHHYAIIID